MKYVIVVAFSLLFTVFVFPIEAFGQVNRVEIGDTAYRCEKSGRHFWYEKPCETIGGTELKRGRFCSTSGILCPESDSPFLSNDVTNDSSTRVAGYTATENNVILQRVVQPDSPPALTAEEISVESFRHLIPHLLIGSILIAVIGSIRGRSGILGFVFCILGGILLHELIFAVSNNGKAGTVGVYVFLAIMFFRALSGKKSY